MSTATISPRELYDLIQQGNDIELIDVRTPAEFGEVHVSCARNVPLDRLDAQAIATGRGDTPVYVICRSGSRGQMGCQKLLAAGLTQVVNVAGGTQAWDQAGLPVIRGKQVMSLERQVRIAAGALVLTGAVLGHIVHPYWIGLSAFVGAGLMFAGITDTCAMGMLIARMPWNQVSSSGTCATKSPSTKSCCS